MNILLTSVGRRAYIVKYFKQAIDKKDCVHVCNSDNLSVAFQYADKSIVSPLIYDDTYIPFLLEYCRKNYIDILISLFDIDLYILAQNKDRFAEIGTQVIVSDPDFISICNDKWKTYLFLQAHDFAAPKTYLTIQDAKEAIANHQLSYPFIVKPRFGCGSIGVSLAENEKELNFYTYLINNQIKKSYLKYESTVPDIVLYQECLTGQEYGVDAICDLNGTFMNAIVKKKLAMRSGETDIAEIEENAEIYSVAKHLSELSHHIGNLDMDFFLMDGVPYILEMNARFGGGYPFSHIAGCDLPAAIIKWHNGKCIDNNILEAKPGIRVYKELCITAEK